MLSQREKNDFLGVKASLSNLNSKLDEKNLRMKEAEENLKKQSDLLDMIESYKVEVKEAIHEKNQELDSSRDDTKLLREEGLNTNEITLRQDNLKIGQLENANKSILDKLELLDALKNKDEEIRQLTSQLENERRVAQHVQFSQERELMNREKEITSLSKILKQERQALLEKEEEIKHLTFKPSLV